MTLLVDEKYLLLLSPSLERFSKKGDHLYNCRCPICGDSEKSKLKSRGYFFHQKDSIFYKCHNCSFSSSFQYFLKQVDESLHRQYTFENFRESPNVPDLFNDEKKTESNFKSLDLPKLSDVNNSVSDYARSRGFTCDQLSRTYYVKNFREWAVHCFGEKYSRTAADERLILPFFDLNDNLVGAQGRSIDPNAKYRYETVKHPDAKFSFFGLDNWNRTKTTYVTEGPIDSLFLPNAVAVASSDLLRVRKFLPESNFVFIWDNEPRSHEICKLIQSAIVNGCNVFIWPSNLTCKDINDAVKSQIDIVDVVEGNVFSGLSAELAFKNWKKIR